MRLHLPSPAMVVAIIALLVALAGTAIAADAVPLAKRALVSDNAKRLGGKTAVQVAGLPGPATSLNGRTAEQIAATPGPASTAADTVVVKTAPLSIPTFETIDASVACDGGQKAVGGGFEVTAGEVFAFDTRPSPEGTSWRLRLGNATDSEATGRLYAICLR